MSNHSFHPRGGRRAATVAALAALTAPALDAYGDAVTAAAYLEAKRGSDADAVSAFLEEMPKGGDLHVHMNGSLPIVDYHEWANLGQSLPKNLILQSRIRWGATDIEGAEISPLIRESGDHNKYSAICLVKLRRIARTFTSDEVPERYYAARCAPIGHELHPDERSELGRFQWAIAQWGDNVPELATEGEQIQTTASVTVDALEKSWSTKGFVNPPLGRFAETGQDHFFRTFMLFGNLSGWHATFGRALAGLARNHARHNGSYMEVMFAIEHWNFGSKQLLAHLARQNDYPLGALTAWRHGGTISLMIDDRLSNASVDAKYNAAFDKVYELITNPPQTARADVGKVFETIEAVQAQINKEAYYHANQDQTCRGLGNDLAAGTLCGVAVRYLAQSTRNKPPLEIMLELAVAFEAASRGLPSNLDATQRAKYQRIVGVNLVQPETGELSLRDYSLHMRMFRYLHAKYPGVKISLHAGEQTADALKQMATSTVFGPHLLGTLEQPNLEVQVNHADPDRRLARVPYHLTFHIAEAVQAGASRIGHGTDLATELAFHDGRDGRFDLLAAMASVLIEIPPTSNDGILRRTGPHSQSRLYGDDPIPVDKPRFHPLTSVMLANRVPVAIATDDAGVDATTITGELVKLVNDFPKADQNGGIGYAELKRMVRNSLHWAFLPGDSLWADASYAAFKGACANKQIAALNTAGVTGCKDYLAANPRAKLQWDLEMQLVVFEASHNAWAL